MITLRLFNVYGVGDYDNKFIPFLINSIKSGADVKMTLGEQIKDYIYIEDIVSAYIHFIEKNI
jgi:nucleoside-diphosphate-sugar epimerase